MFFAIYALSMGICLCVLVSNSRKILAFGKRAVDSEQGATVSMVAVITVIMVSLAAFLPGLNTLLACRWALGKLH